MEAPLKRRSDEARKAYIDGVNEGLRIAIRKIQKADVKLARELELFKISLNLVSED